MSAWYQNTEATATDVDAEGFFKTGDKAKVDDEGYWYISQREDSKR